MKLPLLPVCGVASIVAGVVILKVNPLLPQAFGGSFHGNIKQLSALADAAAMAAILGGVALLALAPLASAFRRRVEKGSASTAEPTSREPSRRSPPSR